MQESKHEYSNFVTPPDFVQEAKHSVLLIDATQDEVQNLAYFCKTVPVYFNIYLFHTGMADTEWLAEVRDQVDAVVVNTVPTEFSMVKDVIAELPKAWHYGEKTIRNSKKLQDAVEYFAKYVQNS